MHGLAVYVKEAIPFAWDISLEILTYVFDRLYFTVSYFVFLYRSPFSSLCEFFDPISSNIYQVLSINPSVSVFVFGDFNVHHKDQLTYSGRNDRPGELCNNAKRSYSDGYFSYSDPRLTLTVPLFWVYFFVLMLVFVPQWLSLHLVILVMLLSQFSLTFHQIHSGMSLFIVQLMTIILLIGMVFVIIREMFLGRISYCFCFCFL